MKRTTIYLEPELEIRLKREARRRRMPMAEIIRDALRNSLLRGPAKPPPGGGAFTSGRKDTAAKAEEVLARSGFGAKSRA
jgi:Ribbon-helix-helix protein, copG family